MRYKFVKSDNKDIYWNFALEEYMLDTIDKDDFIFYVWRNTPSVLIGRHQNVYEECNLENIQKDNVKLVRRRSGGGTVYFDLGNVTYSFISYTKNFDKNKNFDFIIDSLKRLGFITEKSGRNDIIYKGKKFSGNAFYNTSNKSLHHGTIMLNVNMSDLSKYLKVPKRKLESKGIKSVKARVTNLINYSPSLTYEEITNAFYEQYCDLIGEDVKITTLKDLKEDKALHQYYEKHISKDWQFGKNPPFNQCFGDKFDWGSVEFRLFIKDNKVKMAQIYTDSLLPDLFEDIINSMQGIEYDKSACKSLIKKKLDEVISLENTETLNKIKDDLLTLMDKSISL